MARDPLATPDEVAAYLKKSKGTLANWRSLGIGPPYIKAGDGSARYRWADVEKWLASKTVQTGRTA
jgi:hypothetical protein